MSLGVETVQNYLFHLCATFALYKVKRYDIKGKCLLELHEKYFLGDIGLRHALLGYWEANIGGILENIVFLVLKRQGYEVFIGKFGAHEVDFVIWVNLPGRIFPGVRRRKNRENTSGTGSTDEKRWCSRRDSNTRHQD